VKTSCRLPYGRSLNYILRHRSVRRKLYAWRADTTTHYTVSRKSAHRVLDEFPGGSNKPPGAETTRTVVVPEPGSCLRMAIIGLGSYFSSVASTFRPWRADLSFRPPVFGIAGPAGDGRFLRRAQACPERMQKERRPDSQNGPTNSFLHVYHPSTRLKYLWRQDTPISADWADIAEHLVVS